MNYALGDRHRSLRRFLMNALGSPPWTLRTERQPVADELRPLGVVEASTPVVTTRARTSIPQGDIERQQTFSITLYPAVADTAAESLLAAQEAAHLLDQAIAVGLSTDDDPPAVLSAPEMIPVYDFEGVPIKGAARAGPDDGYGWMRVDDYPVRTIQDPEDVLRFTVVCDLRVSWQQGGRVRPPATPVSEGGFAGSWETPGAP